MIKVQSIFYHSKKKNISQLHSYFILGASLCLLVRFLDSMLPKICLKLIPCSL
jgi:hypothetical protein